MPTQLTLREASEGAMQVPPLCTRLSESSHTPPVLAQRCSKSVSHVRCQQTTPLTDWLSHQMKLEALLKRCASGKQRRRNLHLGTWAVVTQATAVEVRHNPVVHQQLVHEHAIKVFCTQAACKRGQLAKAVVAGQQLGPVQDVGS